MNRLRRFEAEAHILKTRLAHMKGRSERLLEPRLDGSHTSSVSVCLSRVRVRPDIRFSQGRGDTVSASGHSSMSCVSIWTFGPGGMTRILATERVGGWRGGPTWLTTI